MKLRLAEAQDLTDVRIPVGLLCRGGENLGGKLVLQGTLGVEPFHPGNDCIKDRPLVPVVPVKRPLGHAQPSGDVADRHGVVAALRKEGTRGQQDIFLCVTHEIFSFSGEW